MSERIQVTPETRPAPPRESIQTGRRRLLHMALGATGAVALSSLFINSAEAAGCSQVRTKARYTTVYPGGDQAAETVIIIPRREDTLVTEDNINGKTVLGQVEGTNLYAVSDEAIPMYAGNPSSESPTTINKTTGVTGEFAIDRKSNHTSTKNGCAQLIVDEYQVIGYENGKPILVKRGYTIYTDNDCKVTVNVNLVVQRPKPTQPPAKMAPPEEPQKPAAPPAPPKEPPVPAPVQMPS